MDCPLQSKSGEVVGDDVESSDRKSSILILDDDFDIVTVIKLRLQQDWFFDVYRNSPREKLLDLMADQPDHEGLRSLPQKELAEILCERYVMNMVAKGFAVKAAGNKRPHSPSQ